MSTRGMIATVRGDGVLFGVYQHYDSYPGGLGNNLLLRYRELGGDIVAMRKEAIEDNPAGWSFYPEDAYSDGDPMTFECRCLAGDSSECDPLFIEWIYVLNVGGLDVYTHVRAGGTHEVSNSSGHTWASPNYRHEFVGTLAWDADKGAVLAMEGRGDEMSLAAWEEYEDKETTVR